MNKITIFIGCAFMVIYFFIHLIIINDYGLSWDFHPHFYSGLYHLGLPYEKIKRFQAPPKVTWADYSTETNLNGPYGPFTAVLPTLSYIIFYEKLHLLPFDSAYNFYIVVMGILGVGVLYFFLLESLGLSVALLGAFFLAVTPNYFGYLHDDMKDIPNAVFFALAIYLFWRLVRKQNGTNLLLAVFSFAIAFNTKINSFIVPFINFLWYIPDKIKELRKRRIAFPFFYFLLSPFAALLLWWPFWKNPISKLLEIPDFFTTATKFMPVLFFGKTLYSGINIPWYYPYAYLGITTPLPILASFIIGLFICVKKIKKNPVYLLLLLYFFVPILRFFVPNTNAIDGVRHFMEVLLPLAAIGGIGAAAGANLIHKVMRQKIYEVVFYMVIFLPLIYNIIHFHPYQTSYFNSLTGGIRGAEGKFDVDFWGTPQKEAVIWLNKNAPINSVVFIAMSGDSASQYIRRDLYNNLTYNDWPNSDYAIILNRQTFIDTYGLRPFINEKVREGKLVHKVVIDTVPLVWVLKK